MTPNTAPSERVVPADVIDPDNAATGTYTTGWVDMSTFQSILAVIQAGALGTSATVDAKLEQAKDDSGTGAKDVSGKSITQLTDGNSDSDKQALINAKAEDLDVQNDFSHVRLSLTVGTAASDVAAVLLGLDPRYGPADLHEASSVAEIV